MRKEYNDRWNAPLVNPGFTWPEYCESKCDCNDEKSQALETSRESTEFALHNSNCKTIQLSQGIK